MKLRLEKGRPQDVTDRLEKEIGDYLIYIVAIVFLSSGSGDMSLMSFEWAFVPSILPVVESVDCCF